MKEAHRLFDRRVIVVLGKGGVGKSSVTAATAVLAASSGMKVLVVELAGQCAMQELLGGPGGGYEPVERRPNLFSLSVTPEESMEEYLVRELRSKQLYRLMFKNPYVAPFIDAVPGLDDLMSIGKVMDLEREKAPNDPERARWDLIVVDAPSTGQGANLLRVAKAMMDMTRMGPFYQSTKLIHDMLTDPRKTVINLVTLPEEMPVNETVEMHRALQRDLDIRQGYLIVNSVREPVVDAGHDKWLRRLYERGPSPSAREPDAIRALLRTALELQRRALLERGHIARLAAEVSLPMISLPLLAVRNLGPNEIDALSARLSHELSGRELEEVGREP